MSDKKIGALISKLIAKAEGTTHPEEADAFMAKAHALLREHGLTLVSLGRLEEDAIDFEDNVHAIDGAEGWARHVLNNLATYYGLRCINAKVAEQKWILGVAGRESARITFKLMGPYVIRQVRREARAMVKAGESPSISKAKTALGNALAFRIARMITEQSKKPDVDAATEKALVPTDRIDALLEELFKGRLKKGHSVRLRTNDAARRRAEGINLSEQVDAAETKQIGSK